ncbi:MAG: lysylphosphatidylglycerol synthase transmembrane domain-containing protein [Gammaproteobacteria bacterium]
MTRRQKYLLALSLILTAGFYLAAVLWAGYEAILQSVSAFSLFDWLLLLSCSMSNYALRFLRWQLYARALGCHLRRGLHFLYYLAGFALTTTPAKAGELLRSIYLKQHGLSYHHSIAMFVSERFLDVLVMACLASLTVFQFGDYGAFVLLACLLMVALLFLIKSTHFKSLLDFVHDRVRWKRLQGPRARWLSVGSGADAG